LLKALETQLWWAFQDLNLDRFDYESKALHYAKGPDSYRGCFPSLMVPVFGADFDLMYGATVVPLDRWYGLTMVRVGRVTTKPFEAKAGAAKIAMTMSLFIYSPWSF
jgi:hypothetical protein